MLCGKDKQVPSVHQPVLKKESMGQHDGRWGRART